jgi:2-polyprenyl-3-methyl-5-hydroxy-6-metoxy-1,4-benzoquinol methylase
MQNKIESDIQNIYEAHHRDSRDKGFSIMENERGDFFRNALGENKNILDLGCRNGVLTAHFVKGNSVTGADIDIASLQEAKEKLNINTIHVNLLGDWAQLYQNDQPKKYDAIVMGEVLEHLYFPEKIIQKVAQHLYDGGVFVGSVPNAFSLKNRVRLFLGRKAGTSLSDPTHINHFTYIELENMFKKYFKEVELSGLGRYKRLSKLFPKIFAFDIVWICKK